MRGKILDSQYNPGYGSWVIKQTKYGTFDSEVFLDEEDKDIDNSFDGCRIAEFDCDLKAYKERAKWLRQRAIGAQILCDYIMLSVDSLRGHKGVNDIIKHTNQMVKEADKARDYYERMKDYRPIFIENILKNRREVRERTEKKEN